MLKHKHIDIICVCAIVVMVALTVMLMNGEALGIQRLSGEPEYKEGIFSDDRVHQVNIQIDEGDWNEMLAFPQDKKYMRCDVSVDGETAYNAAIRTKGNNSMSLTEEYGSDRYSLKIEFDHYDESNTFMGLDKLSLNGAFQDNSYMKDYMTYEMMEKMGVVSPLSSFAYVKINDEDWGLFVAIEEPEESFAKRNYGKDYGKLYKPGYRNVDDPNYDVALVYTDDEYSSYDNIFSNSKFDITDADKDRLINALKVLDGSEKSTESQEVDQIDEQERIKELENAVDVDQVLRYFVVQTFVVNWDSYLGATGHNYFLYEKDGKLSMIPWDYNLAYATYALGMPDPINDSTYFVNNPINTPNEGEVMLNRPMFHKIMSQEQYFDKYHEYYKEFMEEFFDSGYFEKELAKKTKMIGPYVKKDPTKFCSYEDFLLGVSTYREFCLLRAESVKGQLDGSIPASIKGQNNRPDLIINADHINVPDMGDMDDMK